MKNNFKLLLPLVALLAMFTLVSCDESLVKSDYDHTVDPNNVPTGIVTGNAEVYGNKARMAGSIAPGQTLIDYGFVYTIDTLVNKFGSLEKAMLAGQLSSKYMVSMKAKNAGDNFEMIVTGLQPKRDYYYATYAVNYDGLVLGDPELFTTESVVAPLLDISGTSSAAQWSAVKWTQIDKDGDGQKFEYLLLNKKNGMASYTWKTGKKYTPDNFLITPGLNIGIDMRLDYVIYPQGKSLNTETRKSTYAENFSIVISADTITEANCREAYSLYSLRFPIEYSDTLKTDASAAFVDSLRGVVHTLVIPREFENKKVWVAIRHFDVTDQSALFVEKLKIY